MCPRLGMGDANPARRSVGFRSGFVFGPHLMGFVSVAFIPCGWSISFMNIGLWPKVFLRECTQRLTQICTL